MPFPQLETRNQELETKNGRFLTWLCSYLNESIPHGGCFVSYSGFGGEELM